MNLNLHLYKIIATHLAEDLGPESTDEFIEWVMAIYLVDSIRQYEGRQKRPTIPSKNYLHTQIQHSLQVKMYGYYSIDEFRQQNRSQGR